jgi:hypothetical protein
MPGEQDLYTIRQSSSIGRRLLIGVLLLVFVGLVGLTSWMLIRNHDKAVQSAEDAIGDVAAPIKLGLPTAGSGTPSAGPAAPTPEAMASRMTDLEQRLARISVTAQASAGYASRAEAIMVAFAARRAVDAGEPLDYLEDQMRVLFGNAQPKAVSTIINAARDPVTVNKLRAGLDDINGLIQKGDPKEGWWSATMRNLGSLIVIRHAGTPPPDPEQRLARARRAVEAGQIEDAIKELAALPSQPAVAQWLDQARRYNEAHRALDVIEAAAILEPRTTPVPMPSQAQGAAAAPAATPGPGATTPPAPAGAPPSAPATAPAKP